VVAKIKEDKKMINVEVDREQLKELYLQKVEERLKEIELEVFFMDSKQLSAYLNMSWNTIASNLLYEEDFPKVRLGTKWLFNRKEVQEFMQKYYIEIRNNGGDILRYKRKV
jgi:phage pi2 protein 07